jgi:hypothetical protein
LNVCDSEAYWPRLFFYSLLGLLALILGYDFVQRAKSGPKP